MRGLIEHARECIHGRACPAEDRLKEECDEGQEDQATEDRVQQQVVESPGQSAF